MMMMEQSPSAPMGLAAVAALGLLVASCTGADLAGPSTDLLVLSLSEAPVLEIGVMEGDEDYVFQDIVSSFRLASGNLVVVDGGSSQASVFSPSGEFLRRWGGKGEGPGEFRSLGRARPMGTDSLWALDAWTGRLSVFDTAGTFSHQIDPRDLSGDSLFTLDVWLYGRFWVDGALGTESRSRVRVALNRLHAPVGTPGYRVVRVAADGRLWIREPGVTADGMRTWTVVSADGIPEATVDIPARLDPHDMNSGEITGRWLGPSDVHFLRTYGVSETGMTRPAPAWLLPGEPAAEVASPDEEEFQTEIRTVMRQVAIAQEIHYSTHYTYTDIVDSLHLEPAETIEFDVIVANRSGWAGVFTHPGLSHICGLGYGASGPPGWPGGRFVCGPPAVPTTEN